MAKKRKDSKFQEHIESAMPAESVVDFYAGKSVFITGATGFVGKVLVEKLLRSCPTIGKIYLLLRTGRDGATAEERLKELLATKAFTFHHSELALEKLVPIAGDMTAENLGISSSDRATLIDNVSVIFHSAATVRFHGPVKDFVRQNVLGSEAVMQLGSELKNLKSVVYVSTAYANCNLLDIEERVYPLDKPASQIVEEILQSDSDITPAPGDSILQARPNSYTFSKSVAENLVREKFPNLPVVICRPSIVTHSVKDPVEGWCDSMNGLAGTLLLGALGIARTMQIDCNYKADIIPVDYVANSLIVIGWHAASVAAEERPEVVHLTSGAANPVTWAGILNYARKGALKTPSLKLVRPIANNPISSRNTCGRIYHQFVMIFSHYLFAYLFDMILLCTGNKRVMVKVTRKMHRAFDVLEHFTNLEWHFHYKNCSKIMGLLSDKEKDMFNADIGHVDWENYCETLTLGSRRYLLNEDDSTIPEGVKRQKWLIVLYTVLDVVIYAALLYCISWCCLKLYSAAA